MKKAMTLMSTMAVAALLVGCADGPPLVGPSLTPGPSTNPGPSSAPGPAPIIQSAVEGSGNLVTETPQLPSFSGVSVSGAGHLIVEHAGAASLQITADDNILPLLSWEVRNGWLYISTESDSAFRPTELTYRVTAAELEAVSLAGAASTEIDGVEAESFSMEIAGAGRAVVTGRADVHQVTLAGACRYEAADLDSRIVRLDVGGSSDARIRARDRLEGRVSGTSTVAYLGNPVLAVEVSDQAAVQPAS